MTEKTAKDAMTDIAKAFSLDLDATLDLCVFILVNSLYRIYLLYLYSNSFYYPLRDTLNAIMTMGHSRVPVYYENPTNIIGLILVISLLAIQQLSTYSV